MFNVKTLYVISHCLILCKKWVWIYRFGYLTLQLSILSRVLGRVTTMIAEGRGLSVERDLRSGKYEMMGGNGELEETLASSIFEVQQERHWVGSSRGFGSMYQLGLGNDILVHGTYSNGTNTPSGRSKSHKYFIQDYMLYPFCFLL